MIDHTGITVSDFGASRAFYDKAVAPLGASLDGYDIEAVCHAPG